MKNLHTKWLSLLLATVMLLTAVPAFAEETTEVALDPAYEALRAEMLPVTPGTEELTEEEKQVDEYLQEIKKQDAALYGDGVAYGVVNWALDFDSPLYQFIMAMPKGAELHAHGNLAIAFDKYIDLLQDKVMICLAEGKNYGYLYAIGHEEIPEGSVLLSDALNNGQITRDDMVKILAVTDENTGHDAWVQLEQGFKKCKGIRANPEIPELVFEQVFLDNIERGVLLLEVRGGMAADDDTSVSYHVAMREAYYKVKKDHPEFMLKLIGTTGKDADRAPEDACKRLSSAIRISETFLDESDPENPKKLIIGIDFVNEEDASRPLKDYVPFLTSDEVTNSGLGLYLHCGESLRTDNQSVVDALLVNAVRAGHGFNLYRFPEVMKQYAEKKIALEVCPISNYRLGYVSDLRLHPGLLYMRSGIPVTICSDDGLYLTPEPLVDDFYSVTLCWDLSLAELKMLCRNSITYAGLTDEETQELMKNWEAQWDNFIQQQLTQVETLAPAA